jgi:murein hydrolase activator
MFLRTCLLIFRRNIRQCSTPALLLAFLWLTPFVVSAQKKNDLETKKKSLQKEIQLTESLLNETKQNKKLSLNQLVTLNQKISIREELIFTIRTEIKNLQKQVDETKKGIESLEKEIENLKKEYANMVYYAYKNKNSYDRLMFLFSSKDFNQAYRRLKYLQQYSEYRKKQAEAIVAAQAKLDEKIITLNGFLKEKKELLAAEEMEKSQLAVEKKEQLGTLTVLQDKEKELLIAIREKEKEQRNLQLAIQRVIEEEIRKERELAAAKARAAEKAAAEKAAAEAAAKAKANTPATSATNKPVTTAEVATASPAKVAPAASATSASSSLALTAEAQQLSATFELNRNKLPWPVQGVITSKFGEHPHPVLKTIVIRNNGIEIATKAGAEVRSVFDGEVTGILTMPNGHKGVIIRHGEYLSVYTNLKETTVKYGDKVTTRQSIGTVLTDEINAKTEVHFEIYKGQIAQNPQHWLLSNN